MLSVVFVSSPWPILAAGASAPVSGDGKMGTSGHGGRVLLALDPQDYTSQTFQGPAQHAASAIDVGYVSGLMPLVLVIIALAALNSN
jgi:hypothetical protein